MFQYRQVLVRLRAGDSVREIARSGLMGRDKLGELRAAADQRGWLHADAELPSDEAPRWRSRKTFSRLGRSWSAQVEAISCVAHRSPPRF